MICIPNIVDKNDIFKMDHDSYSVIYLNSVMGTESHVSTMNRRKQ